MEIVERILSKVVGAEIAPEELEAVAGGEMDDCTLMGGYHTYAEPPGHGGPFTCDIA